MQINKLSGLPLQIYIPNLQRMQPFEMEFYTNPTSPRQLNIVVSFDGTKYTNCMAWDKGVYLYSEKKFSSDGQLMCRATYYVPSPMVEGGVQKVVIDNIATGITIVSNGGSYFDPVANPSQLQIPSFNDPSCNHVPVFMTYYPGAEKGDRGEQGAKGDKGEVGVAGPAGPQGPQGISGIDMSLLTEQLIPGEFALNLNQVRSQVYIRTFVGTVDGNTWTQLVTLPNSGRVVDGFGSTLQRSALSPNQTIGLASIIRGSSAVNLIGFWHSPLNFYGDTVPAGATYCVTLKYVK